MNLAVYSLRNTLFRGEVAKVIARTSQGQITVLPSHIPLITSVMGPALTVEDAAGKRMDIAISGGILEVRPESEIVVLAEE